MNVTPRNASDKSGPGSAHSDVTRTEESTVKTILTAVYTMPGLDYMSDSSCVAVAIIPVSYIASRQSSRVKAPESNSGTPYCSPLN